MKDLSVQRCNKLQLQDSLRAARFTHSLCCGCENICVTHSNQQPERQLRISSFLNLWGISLCSTPCWWPSCACSADNCKKTAEHTWTPFQTSRCSYTFPQPQLWRLPQLVLTERARWIQKGGRMLLAWSSCWRRISSSSFCCMPLSRDLAEKHHRD